MIFGRAWVLFFAVLPLAWAWWEWGKSARRGALILKAAAMLCVALALAEPRLPYQATKVALAVVADTSASVSDADLAASSDLISRFDKARGANWMRVLPFARAARPLSPEERRSGWTLRRTAGENGQATNLEAAMREALAALPSGMVRRVALISDGNDNLGSTARAIWQARELGVAVDTFRLAGRPKPQLHIESVVFPATVFSGEKFPIDLTVASPRAGKASLEIAAEGKTLGTHTLALGAGTNRVRVTTSVAAIGATGIGGRISSPELGEARFEQAVAMRRPRVLFVSRDPAESEAHLARTLEANQFEIERAPNGLPERLDAYQLVLFNNWDMEAIPPARKALLEEYVKGGGGLLWVAGDRNTYVEKRGVEDALERALPAKLAPPRSPEGTCVVLIVDKSSSMEGKKMELARLAAIGVIENLRPIDMVGVLIFDNSFQWAVPIRRAEDRSLIKRLVAGITPDGGTQIAPALAEGYKRIAPQQAIYKHVVLLTDGISEEGDSLALAREAQGSKTTISTVGLGQDVNRAYLEKIAQFAGGKSYFLNDPNGLEQILLKDVMEHTGSTAVEKAYRPRVMRAAEILDGVGIESAPPLQGYIRFVSKPSADTILNADARDPLLARWQFGLGRSAVFASDAKNRWANAWLTWPGFDRFWTNLFRDLLPHAQASEATAEYDSAAGELVVDYRLSRGVDDPGAAPELFAFGPAGFQAPAPVQKMAAGHYRARVPIGRQQGLFRVRPVVETRAFPEVGLYRPVDELQQYGSDEALLRRIASGTGGRFQPDPKTVFDASGQSIPAVMELWPGLLALAVLLNLAEVFLRKWRGVMAGMRPASRRIAA